MQMDMPKAASGRDSRYIRFEYFKECKREFVPYVLYGDFECILRPLPSNDIAKQHRHEVSSYAYLVISRNPADPQSNYSVKSYRDVDPVKNVWKVIREEVIEIGKRYAHVHPIRISREQLASFNTSPSHVCHICGKMVEHAVKDHCHLTGLYRGPACPTCNLRYKLPAFVPVVFHGGSNYDMKFLIREMPITTADDAESENEPNDRVLSPPSPKRSKLEKSSANGDLYLLCNNSEKLITFSRKVWFDDDYGKRRYVEVKFIDSYRFLNSSLSKIASILRASRFVHRTRYQEGCFSVRVR